MQFCRKQGRGNYSGFTTNNLNMEKGKYHNGYIKGENLIYVCVNNTCKYPVSTVDEALKLITNNNE